MSSKMVPLWLVFKNYDDDAPPIYIIFKSGDDLRQDILTLQILTVMDRLWLSAGLDMRMKPYKVSQCALALCLRDADLPVARRAGRGVLCTASA